MPINQPVRKAVIRRGIPIRAEDIINIGRMAERGNAEPGQYGKTAPAIEPSLPCIIAQMRNATSGFIAPGDVLHISGQWDTTASENQHAPILVGGAFADEGDLDRFAIAMDTMFADQVARVAVAGIAWANVMGSGQYASPQIGENAFILGSDGYAINLWDDGTKALLLFPAGSAGIFPANWYFVAPDGA